jgi:hypothetical protein
MYEENQSFVADSFMALYVKPGQYKPSLPRTELLQRYELCEDLATMLQDTVSTQQFQLGITEDDALKTPSLKLMPKQKIVSLVKIGV